MQVLANRHVRIILDDRWPRIIRYERPGGKVSVPGEPTAAPPKVYVFRGSDLSELTSDDAEVGVRYDLTASGESAMYRAAVTVDGQAAAEFDLTITLAGPDAKIVLGNVTEHRGYYLLTLRLGRVVAASSRDADARVVTCGWQGRLLDPRKCQPGLTDYSWHGSVARHCGAAWRDGFMVTFDMLGYEDLFIQEVRQHSRIAGAQTVASLGGELMYRQRTIEDPNSGLKIFPPPGSNPPAERLKVPILCAKSKQISLHFIAPRGGRKLDWPDAAMYFQSTLPKSWRCEKRYDGALVYKILLNMARPPGALTTFEQAFEVVKRLYHLTDGMKQVCYLTGMQPGSRGTPNSFAIDPAVGDRNRLRKVIAEAPRYNTVLSMHDLPTQADVGGPNFNPDVIIRDTLGRMWDAGVWDNIQLVEVSPPEALAEMKKIPARLVREFGVHTSYHCDTFGGFPFHFDADPRHPHNATEVNQANFEFVKELRRHGIDLTVESLAHAYVPWVGHVWALFNYGRIWQGEERIPFANFIYHGAISYNGGHGAIPISWFSDKADADIRDTVMGSLAQGGGAGIEFPDTARNMNNLIDLLHLVQPPYIMLRSRKWTGYRRRGEVHRVQYAPAATSPAGGSSSFIEIDAAKMTYRVQVDGVVVAEDFKTVYPGPRKGTMLAYSMTDCDLDWPAPRGWKNGPVNAVLLTETGPGVTLPARVEKGRLRLHLRAHQPVRLSAR